MENKIIIFKKSGVYKLTNKINGKNYIGKSLTLKRRIKDHETCKDSSVIHSAIIKYGWDNFEVEILAEFEQIDNIELLALEAAFIEYFDTLVDNGKGYNVCLFGTDRTGIKNSKETREKISFKNKGRFAGEKNPMFGKRHPPELQKQINAKKSGVNHFNYGKHLCEETRRKISIANTGYKHSDEAKKRMSEQRKGKKVGRIMPDHVKQKLKESKMRKVKQINPITNEIVKIWDSITDAAKEVKSCCTNICRACTKIGKRNKPILCRDFRWEYV